MASKIPILEPGKWQKYIQALFPNHDVFMDRSSTTTYDGRVNRYKFGIQNKPDDSKRINNHTHILPMYVGEITYYTNGTGIVVVDENHKIVIDILSQFFNIRNVGEIAGTCIKIFNKLKKSSLTKTFNKAVKKLYYINKRIKPIESATNTPTYKTVHCSDVTYTYCYHNSDRPNKFTIRIFFDLINHEVNYSIYSRRVCNKNVAIALINERILRLK